jgi:hypothetical protein
MSGYPPTWIDTAERDKRMAHVMHERELQRSGGAGRMAPSDTLIIAASLTAAHFGDGVLLREASVVEQENG